MTKDQESSIGLSYVRAIAPYVGGKPISEVAREFGLDEKARGIISAISF